MEPQERLKKIIAPFLNLDPSEITSETSLARTSLVSSTIHFRMLASLAGEGFRVSTPGKVKTFEDLVRILGFAGADGGDNGHFATLPMDVPTPLVNRGLSLGIDVVMRSEMPECEDYRMDAFYKETFSEREIAECLSRKDFRLSFAGRFAVKEALIKADNSLGLLPLNRLEVLSDEQGRPMFPGFAVSITHGPEFAVAAAARGNTSPDFAGSPSGDSTPAKIDSPAGRPCCVSPVSFNILLFFLVLFFLLLMLWCLQGRGLIS